MNERLAQVNRMLDRACKQAGQDPIDVRLAMIQVLKRKTGLQQASMIRVKRDKEA